MLVNISWWELLLGVVLPMLTGVATKQLAHPGLKAVVLAALSALAGVVAAIVMAAGNVAGLDWNVVGSTALESFLLAIAFHFGLLKPLNATGSGGGIARATADVGVGTNAGRHAA